MERCVICGADSATGHAPFLFCGPHGTQWLASAERRRVKEMRGSPVALTAIEDFIRRVAAENRNGG